jgi:Holliday junction DNA helicase RuvB
LSDEFEAVMAQVTADATPEERAFEAALRPRTLNELIGQERLTMSYSPARPAWARRPSP